MASVSRSRRTLGALLNEARLPRAVSIDILAIGWLGRGGGGYRDDDGTHARVSLIDDRSVIYREYATTSRAARRYRMKESFVLGQLRHAGLPTPKILAATDGIEAGAPPAMLYSDAGGAPLEEHASASLPPQDQVALWAEVGRRLRQLHDVDVAAAGPLAEPANDRPWMQTVPYFAKSLRAFKKKHPSLGDTVDEFLAILRGPVAAHVASRPRSICCGHYALPGLMLDASGRDWHAKSWLSLGYYVSVGDPDRDITAIATLYRRRAGTNLPDAFYAAYGRHPDPIGEVVYDAYLRMHAEPTAIGEAVARLEELCR